MEWALSWNIFVSERVMHGGDTAALLLTSASTGREAARTQGGIVPRQLGVTGCGLLGGTSEPAVTSGLVLGFLSSVAHGGPSRGCGRRSRGVTWSEERLRVPVLLSASLCPGKIRALVRLTLESDGPHSPPHLVLAALERARYLF